MLGYFRLRYIILRYDRSPSVTLCYLSLSYKCGRVGFFLKKQAVKLGNGCSSYALTLILRRSRTGTVWFYTSASNKRAARPKLYTKSLTRDLKRMYIRLTLARISINL